MKLLIKNSFIIPSLCLLVMTTAGTGYAQVDSIPTERTDYTVNSDRFFTVQIYGDFVDELQQLITIDYADEPRKEVIKEIARLGNLGVALDEDHNWLHNRISLVLEDATIAESLTYALANTGYEAAITRRREIVLLEKELLEEQASSSSQQEEQTQYGVVAGEIRDADTGETLPGANVVIQGTTLGVSTDIDGRYTLRRVPAGDQVLEISYIGYEVREIPVTIEVDERVIMDISLQSTMVEGDEILVVAHQRGQARALTRQRQSLNIRSVVSSEMMDRFADQTVEGSLQRIAGMGHGGANIRGVGPGASNITMDGQRMGSTGTGDRAVDVGTISSDMVEQLEVIKVVTPDMDADALSGVVNISTRRPVGAERSINVRLGGGYTPRYGEFSGPARRVSFSYGDSPRDNFTYAVNLGYQRSTPGMEWLRTDWGIRNFGEGPVDVLSDFRTGMEFGMRDRYSTAVQLTFQPSDRSTYHVQGMFNYQQRLTEDHEYRYTMDPDRFINRFETGRIRPGDPAGRFRMQYGAELTDQDINQYTVQLGGRHLFDRFDLEYALGWGHGRYYRDRYWTGVRTRTYFDWIIGYEDRWHPTIDIHPEGRITSYPTDMDEWRFRHEHHEHRWDNHVDNELKASIDLEASYRLGTFKFGSSGLMTFKDGRPERYSNDYVNVATLTQLPLRVKSEWKVFEREHQSYHMPWIMDMNSIRQWYENNIPDFYTDISRWASVAEGDIYAANEYTFGTYGMSTIELGRLKLLGGVRVELSGNSYEGRLGITDSDGTWRGAVDIESSNQYVHMFPNAQIVYGLGDRTNARLAYSRTIGRPDFSQLSPSTIIDYSSERITRGNPDLKPMLSNNLDLLFEHYFLQVGQLSLGLYYKELSDFAYRRTIRLGDEGIDDVGMEGRTGTEGDEAGTGMFAGWELREYQSGDKATVYGLEASWQQRLSFLPGFLGNFSTYANYSYAYSEAELDRPEPGRLTGQRPHVVNVGFDYSQGPFSGQLSYHWGAPSISSYATEPRWVPEIQLQERVWFDTFRDAASDLSLTLRYRLTDNFRLWADATNILNHRSVSYNYDREYYPRTARLRGRSFSMGVRYTL